MATWLEISADYRCNNRCLGCFSVSGAEGGAGMDTQEAVATLVRGREAGARFLWLGGGEPTLRRDLMGLVRRARRLGYERVKLQTNGMMLAYADFAARCAEAGVTEVNLSIKGATAERHDALSRTPGAHALLVEGLGRCRDLGLALEGDLLLYRDNLDQLPEMVRVYHGLGVARFNLWLFSATGEAGAGLEGQVPRMSELVPRIQAALDLGLSERPDFITSLHTPPCVVPEAMHRVLFHAAALDLLVANPGGYAFKLEASPIEGGYYHPGCAGCRFRARCGGMRRDYVAIHGEAEFVAVG